MPTDAPTRCPDCGEPLYRATDVYVVCCWACGRDFVTTRHNDYLLDAPQYADAITGGPRVARRYGANDHDAKRPQRRHVCFPCGLPILDGAEVTETSSGALVHSACEPERYAREVLRREPPRVQ